MRETERERVCVFVCVCVYIDWGRGRFEWSKPPQISGAVLGKKGLAPWSPSRQRPWDERKLERSRLELRQTCGRVTGCPWRK